jgi:hypothetical protein
MRSLAHLTLLTLVAFYQLTFGLGLSQARASVGDPSPDFRDSPATPDAGATNSRDAEIKSPDELEKRRTIDIKVPPPEAKKSRAISVVDEFFYPYHYGLTLALGETYAKESRETNSDTKPLSTALGLQFVFPTWNFTAYEFGAFLLTNSTARLHFSRRFIYSQDRLRPYSAVGVGLALFPADEFANFVQLRNYQLRGAAGFEYSIGRLNHGSTLRLELAAAFGLNAQDVALTIGQVWGW